ncbi:hypothetical protein Golob_021602 [Gossypium lobatum]|uniref:Aminotransferase-like plant mobile domain-containing protein n=1 Tax=Gossypium lobatum TaxID=34289 RepID=A0A7J8LE13_9ROSI|nr:hypothetical protein [Gossypium lobatum]
MDGPFVTGAVIIPRKEDLCKTFLGKVPNKFQECGQLSWGLAVLATLYQELYRAIEPNKMSIGGCLLLLQSWAWWRLPFLRPRVDTPYTFPLMTKWNHGPRYVGLPEQLKDIRLLLDQRSKFEISY